MKNWLFLSLILLSSSWVQASDLAPLINFLSGKEMIPGTVNCELSDEDHFQACAISLCGKPQKIKMERTKKELLDQYDSKRFGEVSKVEKNLRELLDKYQSKTLKDIEAISTPIMKEAYFKELESMDDGSWEDLARKKFQGYVYEEFDDLRPMGEKYSISLNLPSEPITEKMRKSLEAYAKKLTVSRNSLVDVWSLSLEDARARLNLLWKDNKQSFEKLDPTEFQRLSDKVKSSADMGGFDLKEFLEEFSSRVNLVNPTLFCKDSECRKDLTEIILENDVSSLKRDLSNKDFVSSILPTCLASYIQHGARKVEEEKFRKLIPGILERIEKKIMKSYSDHSRLAYKKIFSEITLDFGERIDPSLEVQRVEANLKINEELSSPKKYLDKFKSYGLYNDSFKEIPFCKPAISSEIISDKFVSGDVTDFSGAVSRTPLTISDVSCMHANYGQEVFAHEAGHVLSYAIQNNLLSETSKIEFLKTRSCISGKSNLSFANDSKYTEEDMADHVSSIAYADSEINQNCFLLKHENEKYIDLGFENSIKADTHSSAFTRLMRETLYKKRELGESCQYLYSQYKNQVRLDPCE